MANRGTERGDRRGRAPHGGCASPRTGPGAPSPIVILCARFATSRLRSRAAAVAMKLRVRFLLVEANSSTHHCVRRLSRMLLTAEEMAGRLERYRLELEDFEQVSASEVRHLPTSSWAGSLLGNLEGATASVVEAWLQGRH